MAELQRDEQRNRLRRRNHERNIAQDFPFCFGDVGVLFHNESITPNPCHRCDKYTECGDVGRPKINAGKMDSSISCFAIAAVRLEDRDSCMTCRHVLACSEIVDERFNRPPDGTIAPMELPWPKSGELGLTVDKYLPPTKVVAPVPTAALSAADAPRVSRVPAHLAVPAVSVTTASPTVFASSTYHFPDTPTYLGLLEEMRKKTPLQLRTFIALASAEPAKGKAVPYARIRERFCAASIALNEHDSFPPRVRDTRTFKKPFGARVPIEDSELSNDRQVIDFHWLKCHETVAPEKRWARMFEGDALDFDLASELAALVWKPTNKARAIGLSPTQEFKLAVIQSKATYDRWRSILRGKQGVLTAIQRAQDRGGPQISPATAKALPDAYVALRIADDRPSAAAKVYRSFTGVDIPPDKLGRCRDWLEKNMKAA